jgi:hypothetical protein
MRLAPMHWSIAVALALGASRISFALQHPPATASECKSAIREKDFDVQPDGPFLQRIGYSSVLHACVVVVVQVLPIAPPNEFDAYTEIGNSAQRKSIWHDRRRIRQADRALEAYPAFEEQLHKLEITLVNR